MYITAISVSGYGGAAVSQTLPPQAASLLSAKEQRSDAKRTLPEEPTRKDKKVREDKRESSRDEEKGSMHEMEMADEKRTTAESGPRDEKGRRGSDEVAASLNLDECELLHQAGTVDRLGK